MRLYLIERVVKLEHSEEFKKLEEEAERFRMAAARRWDTE
jgi:hypothetical protein